MRKFKINRSNNNTEPSDEQIKRHKDFSRLSHEYQQLTKRSKKPIYKDPKKFLYIIIAGIIIYIIYSKR